VRSKIFVFSAFTFYLSLFTYHAFAAISWNEVKGDHFLVYYENNESFAREVLRNSEMYYTRIAEDLGYPRYSNFWSWENRAKIFIYASEKTFREATGEAEWSHGMASYSKKEIHTFQSGRNFLISILPHEITHLIFRDFVGFEGQVPLWMDEGVAQWEEPEKREMALLIARYLIKTDQDYPIQDLMTTDVRSLQDEAKVHAFYMQSVTLVDFLVKSYGGQRFTEFCRQLRDGKKFNDALSGAYTGRIENLYDLDQKWRKYVMAIDVKPQTEVYT
jgi:hypothetical protein